MTFLVNLFLLMSLLTAQVVDALQTGQILALGGREANQLMAWLMARFGEVRTLVVAKALIMTGLTAMVCLAFDNRLVAGAQMVLLVFYGWVIGRNFKILEDLDGD